jgi:nitronate monooxygenase
MAIRTSFTELFRLDYPIMLAPMALASGGELAAAVSNAGGLGLVGGGYGDPAWLTRELEIARSKATRRWGVGLITWKATDELVSLALSYKPNAFFLSFGDPLRFARQIKSAGCLLICQVQDIESTVQAKNAGADLIVAQGAEAGGHGATRATLPLVPTVIDAASPIPVLAAGGIADGRGLAAALALGAAGAVIGTRFCATEEALTHPDAKERLVRAGGGDTVRTRVFDEVRGYDWPEPYSGRALRNQFVDAWHGQEAALRASEPTRQEYQAALRSGDFETAAVWAGEAVDLVSSVAPAGELVRRISDDAEQQLRRLIQLLA